VDETIKLWKRLMAQLDLESLQNALTSEQLSTWMKLISTPNGVPYDGSLLLQIKPMLQVFQ
jgi:hypothetical protein